MHAWLVRSLLTALSISCMSTDMAVAQRRPVPDAQMKAVLDEYPIAGSDTNTPSYRENAAAKPLNRAMMKWFFSHYLRTSEDRNDPRINLVAANLKGLPPTTIITAEIDPLRSEGAMLARLMEEAGVSVRYRHYDGVAHEFFGMSAAVDKAGHAQQFAADDLKRSFADMPAAR